MSAELAETAPAKINLTLRVLKRRADGYHDLESLVAFAEIADRLTLHIGESIQLDVIGPYASACGPMKDNLILKAFAALSERVPGIVGGRFLLEKNLPVAAGIGGGSSDAAAALRLLARANALDLKDARLFSAARAVGADVPVCLEPKPRVMRGVGELLSEPLIMPLLPAVLVNPGVPLATRDVFARLSSFDNATTSLTNIPDTYDGVIGFLKDHGNNLTCPAMACGPAVAKVLEVLSRLPAVQLARMSGSGPTCFALFATNSEAEAAALQIRGEHPNWWVCATTLG